MTPDYSGLPLLVVHGAIVWKLLLATFVGVSVVAYLAARTWWTRRKTRRASASFAPRPIGPVLLVLAISGGGGYGALRAIGHAALDRARDSSFAERAPLELGATDPLVVAAAMPATRERALWNLTLELEEHSWRDAAAVERLLALVELIEPCYALKVYWGNHRYEDALAAARRCGERSAERLALAILGRYQEALDIPVDEEGWPHREVILAITAGRWHLAAAAADRAVTEEERVGRSWGDDGDVELRSFAERSARRYRCLAELFRHHGGDADAAGRLSSVAGDVPVDPCLLAFIETQPPEERRGRLRRAVGGWSENLHVATPVTSRIDSTTHPLALELLWAEGDDVEPPSLSPRAAADVLVRHRRMGAGWLAPWAAAARRERASSDPDGLASVRAFEAALAVYRGDGGVARVAATAAGELVAAAVALRTAAPSLPDVKPPDLLGVLAHARLGRDLSEVTKPTSEVFAASPTECRSRYFESLREAQRGDATQLARVLHGCELRSREILMAVIPRVTRGRRELGQALVWTRRRDDQHLADPFQIVDTAAFQRDLLRLAGLEDEAVMWHAIVERNLEVFSDRRRLVALLLWSGS